MTNDLMSMTTPTGYTDEEKLKAAYALNLCTVSVSQIIDYNDMFVLEQEYDAILNNLNLKEIPKDDALLRILSEILNTLTFFRVQDIRKSQMERKYQRQMKNAIWNAIPSLSVVVSGNPVAMAVAIATQVGTGYMNYRKAKSEALADKEDTEIELQITAIEQLNALRRELFTTAWRLAKEYDFNDEWRLTEQQIKQYNTILMDTNNYRKYFRLESIQDKFKAYPPFWYYLGHSANCIAEEEKDVTIKNQYRKYAKECFDYFCRISQKNILRYDLITASCALEYIDILCQDLSIDKGKIEELADLAVSMAGNSLDILQLCAISYLKIGETDRTAGMLKYLVNENYNTSMNAKLLSRIYVSQYFSKDLEKAEKAYVSYQMLTRVSEESYLFPLPERYPDHLELEDNRLQKEYIVKQINELKKDYLYMIRGFILSYTIKYNMLWPAPRNANVDSEDYYSNEPQAKRIRECDMKKALEGADKFSYISELENASIRLRYVDLLNDMLRDLEELSLFRNSKDKQRLIAILKSKILSTKREQAEFQKKLEEETFSYTDYVAIQKTLSLYNFTKMFFLKLRSDILDQLDNSIELSEIMGITQSQYLENAEIELVEFCGNHNIPEPGKMRKQKKGDKEVAPYIVYDYLGADAAQEEDKRKTMEEMKNCVVEYAPKIVLDAEKTEFLLPGQDKFDAYFKNNRLDEEQLVKGSTIGILDDKTKKNNDLLFGYKGITIVTKDRKRCQIEYYDIMVSKGSHDTKVLSFGLFYDRAYSNDSVSIGDLYDMIQTLMKF